MDIGVTMFSTDYSMRIDDLAREVEARGFESLFVPEHTHIPTSRRSPFAGGAELPKEYWHTVDPFVGLMAAAAVTKKLKVGTGICLIIERDPITTAKEVASLDLLSGGRFLFGIGAGWNAEEMENHKTEFKSRYRRMREQVLAMKEIWTKDEAQYHGEHVDFDPIWSWPKPAQKPHPPVLLGGESGHTLQRVVDFCEGWFPRGRAGDVILSGLEDLQARAARAGRDMKTISVSVFGAKPDEATLVPEKRQELTTEGGLDVIANEAAVRGAIDRLKAAGIQVSLFIDPEPRQIDASAKFGADAIEIQTASYSEAVGETAVAAELDKLRTATAHALGQGLHVHMGHGLNYHNVQSVARLPHLEELNIGHSIVSRAIFVGLERAVREMKQTMMDNFSTARKY